VGRGRRRVGLRRLDAVHPLTGAGEIVYTGGDNLVRPREASVTLADCAAVLCPAGPVRVTFVTQTRLKHAGAFARRPDFQVLRDETRWTRWARYSARQDRRMEWEGLVGEAVYEGDLAPFWPYLVFGQWTHAGSATTFGLGRYRIEPSGDDPKGEGDG
jgi:hypothetical protein